MHILVDEAGDTHDVPTASQATDGRLGDAPDVVPEDRAGMPGAVLSRIFASFSASRHLSGAVALLGSEGGLRLSGLG